MDRDIAEKQKVITYSVDVYIMLGLITLFAYFSLKFISPFVAILAWAAILAIALHPLFEKLREAVGGRHGLAATIIAVTGLVILIITSILIAKSMVGTLGDLAQSLRNDTFAIPAPAESVRGWPWIGERIYLIWNDAHTDIGATLKTYRPQIERIALSMAGAGGGILLGVLQFILSIVFASVFLAFSDPLSQATSTLAGRISTTRGRKFVEMAGATVRNVSRGILGVAVSQGGLASIGVFVAGLPFAGFLSAIAVAACVVQVPILVIAPMIIYVWSAQSTVFAAIFTAYMVPVLLSDNVLKPILMARGLETPMIVILVGVIGGTISSGLMGLFLGPVVLALFYKMILVWIGRDESESAGAAQNTPSA
jgi:predicted PurR-regulated permease PerM